MLSKQRRIIDELEAAVQTLDQPLRLSGGDKICLLLYHLLLSYPSPGEFLKDEEASWISCDVPEKVEGVGVFREVNIDANEFCKTSRK
jgi:hypothetical protein